jgi:endosialidase-like protein
LSTRSLRTLIILAILLMIPFTLLAQTSTDVPLRPWPAPLFWQPTSAETQPAVAADQVNATTPANSLVFVGMTPCRVADTRNGSGFTGAFGPPSLVGGAKRTFPIQSSPNCSIPAIAQAYSFNITIVPPGFVDFVTVGPTPVSTPPTFSTLNGYVCAFSASACVISNAAIVPAGTSGSVDVYASQSTNLLIDINGYYAAQSGITLAQGGAGAPSLSFSGDPGTGIFSSGAGTLNIATGGTNRLQVLSNGDLNQVGNLTVGGNVGVGTTSPALVSGTTGKMIEIQHANNPGLALTNTTSGGQFFLYSGSALGLPGSNSFHIHDTTTGMDRFTVNATGSVGIGTTTPNTKLDVRGNITIENGGDPVIYTTTAGSEQNRYLHIINSPSYPSGAGLMLGSILVADTETYASPARNNLIVKGRVGIGTPSPTSGNLDVEGGIHGHNTGSAGVVGDSTCCDGILGLSTNGVGVRGSSSTSYAGFFSGDVNVTGTLHYGTLAQNSDVRLKEGISNLGYGLPQILQLRPVSYNWKDKPNTGRQFGLIAQEVEPLLPELVTTDKDAEQTKGLNYVGLVPVTIRAIQEQQAQIEDQKKRIADLEDEKLQQQDQNRKLEERLAAVEVLLSSKAN